MIKKKSAEFIIKIICISLVVCIIYAVLKIKIIQEIGTVMFISFLISYVLKPIQEFLYKKGIKRKVAAILLIGGIIGFVALFVGYFMPVIIIEGQKFFDSIDSIKGSIKESYNAFIKKNQIFVYMDSYIKAIGSKIEAEIVAKASNWLAIFCKSALSIASVPIISYYFLSEGKFFEKRMMMAVPIKKRKTVKEILDDIDLTLSRYVCSQFVLSIIIAFLTFIILATFRIDFPIILSVVNGLANIIPYFGPVLGAVPSIIMAAVICPEKSLYIGICLFLIQQIEGNIISPKIIGDSISMHPIIVIILLIAGEKAGGFMGMILAVPIGVVIKIIYEDLNYYLF